MVNVLLFMLLIIMAFIHNMSIIIKSLYTIIILIIVIAKIHLYFIKKNNN